MIKKFRIFCFCPFASCALFIWKSVTRVDHAKFPQGLTVHSGLLLGQGDVLTMFSSAKIYHVQWSIDGLGRRVVHA